MKRTWTANELYYRKTISSVGLTMLAFLLLMSGFKLMNASYQAALNALPIPKIEAEIAGELGYAAGYLLVFMLPAIVLKRRLQRLGFPHQPMKAELGISGNLPVLVLGGACLIWTQSYLNAAMVSVFHYAEFSETVLWDTATAHHGYQIVLQFIVIALVPAFCEEFLFRGAILTNLLPFGRVPAIMISSLLFSMMHQNAEQIFYAFGAGILLGLIYERTGSIWNCFFLHLFNNFFSVAIKIVSKKIHYDSEIGWAIVETAFCLVGILCVVLLAKALSAKRTPVENGVFGKSVAAADSYAAYPLPSRRLVQLFFSVPMLIFVGLSIMQILRRIGMAWVNYYGS